MHCLLPHCGGPTHFTTHPQNNSNHNHIHPHNHQPPVPPPQSLSPQHHLRQMNLAQQQQQPLHHHHHHHHPGQQSPQYRIVASNPRSDFHVPGQNYGAQPGGQVGGGGGSIGVSGGRGPPSLNIQTIGQTTQGIQSGSGPAGGQQQSNQAPTSGVQQQQTQGQAPTSTPLVHTPSPQEMGKQIHHQTQAASLQQSYVPNQTRTVPQAFYPMGARQMQSRGGPGHRNNQGGGVTHVIGMQSTPGAGGQPPAMFQAHHTNINVPGAQTIYIPSQVPNMHPGQHQPSLYSVSSQMTQIPYPQQHRHPTHGGQHFVSYHQGHTILPQSMYSFQPGPATQPFATFCFPAHPPNALMNSTRANNNTISGGQHVSPLAGAQATTSVPQGTLQQTTPQPQTLPPMALPLSQPAYPGHNAATANSLNNSYQKPATRPKAIMDIVNPATGENIADNIYRDAKSTSDDSNTRETSQTHNPAIAAEFASRVAKMASEDSSVNSNSSAASAQSNHQQSINTVKSQPSLTKDSVNIQCNKLSSEPTQINTNTVQAASPESTHSTAPVAVDSSVPVKMESKPTMAQVVDSKPQTEVQSASCVEGTSPVSGSPKDDNVIVQQPPAAALSSTPSSTPESELKNTSAENSSPTNISNVPPFSSSNVKNSSSSPPRRKNNNHVSQNVQQQFQSQSAGTCSVVTNSGYAAETAKDPKDKKASEKAFVPKVASQAAVQHQTDVPQQQQHQQKANGERIEDKIDVESGGKIDLPQKSADGNKTMQKQKNKNKFKGRDINRKGAEKEGTDMDAFVNSTLQSAAPEVVKSQELIESSSSPSSKTASVNIEQAPARETSTEEKEVCEVKIDDADHETQQTQVKSQPADKIITNSSECPVKDVDGGDDKIIVTPNKNTPDNETISNDMIIQDSNKCASMMDKKTNDVVDHSKVIVNDTVGSAVEAIVAQKNEENAKVSTLAGQNYAVSEAPVIDSNKQNENEPPNKIEPPAKPAAPVLRYQYSPNQWSPKNTSGKKEYDRDFLMKLQDDPRSRIKPPNLPDLDVVLKDCSRQTSRNTTVDLRMFKDSRAHEQLLPVFMKSSYNPKPPLTSKKSYQGKSKSSKPNNLIHVTLSLHEDVKLRETENAWKPARLKKDGEAITEDDIKTQSLYKKVRSVLNKLTPQKFETLVNQVRTLEIDSEEKLQGVIDLVFEKAIDEPNFSVAYALMCKELALIKVASSQKKSPQEPDNNVNFRKLLLTRCQMEFEKNTADEAERSTKVKEIEECSDPDKKKDLVLALQNSDRLMRMKSVGNIRFIGELYKQEMLTANIMNKCIKHLLDNSDEDNIECLCKLLTTIGKIFELKANLSGYFNILSDLASNHKGNSKISSRVRFMIQDVIDLRRNNWIPRRDDSNPKTMDQIQKEAESERIDIQFNNNISLNTPRKDDRNDRRRRGAGSSLDDGGWQPVGSKVRQSYSVEASKLNTKTMPLTEITLGSRNNYVWNSSSAAPGKPITPVTPNKFAILESMSLDQDKRPPIPLSGSRSTGPREYRSDYKTWGDGSRGSRNGSSHQMGSSSSISSSSRESSLLMEGARSQSISMPPPAMKMKPPTIAPVSSNTASGSNSSINISNKTPKTEAQLLTVFKSLIDGCSMVKNQDAFIVAAMETITDNFDSSSYQLFVSETVNKVLERSAEVRRRYSALLSHLIKENIIPLSLVQSEYEKVLEIADDLVIDIPKIWEYIAEILLEMLMSGAHPFAELKKTLAVLKNAGTCSRTLGELLSTLAKEKGPKWVADNWDQSGLQWSDLLDLERENLDDMLNKYKLEFLTKGCSNLSEKLTSGDSNMSYSDIGDHLVKLMKESNFDNITSWITLNVGQRLKEPLFVRTLTTSILTVSIEKSVKSYKLVPTTLSGLLPLIRRYVDTEPQLELQCLFAIQSHLHKLDFPQGVLNSVIESLWDEDLISDDAFLAWQECTDPAEIAQGHSVAVKSLTSFFVNLQEIRDESSEEA
ncbi:eukaryotic translation initiation factor 4 gamma 3-like isoform X3 [Microplitis mediator]|uniref:eukaryotic translation initiation factor 4 gamma 3-like isoform X3 n=1 Tax=Microplitis mediator TaxID=375433 RepID=UPI00255247B8|nr:eukaryotic translation initiation factor 4 gamma 3-like isoform X3 [Microplitis mediator]